MRKKLLVILLLLVVLIVLVVTRCGGKKDQQNDPADGQGFAQQSGKAAAFLYVLLGVRTVYAPLMSVPARETLRAHGIEAIADAVVLAIRNRTDTGFCPMESAVWDISDPCEAKAALERRISEMMAKK